MGPSDPKPLPLDISMEKERHYTYGPGREFIINSPLSLYVLQNGSHRVVDVNGLVHRPTPGYVGISWLPRDPKVPFVA